MAGGRVVEREEAGRAVAVMAAGRAEARAEAMELGMEVVMEVERVVAARAVAMEAVMEVERAVVPVEAMEAAMAVVKAAVRAVVKEEVKVVAAMVVVKKALDSNDCRLGKIAQLCKRRKCTRCWCHRSCRYDTDSRRIQSLCILCRRHPSSGCMRLPGRCCQCSLSSHYNLRHLPCPGTALHLGTRCNLFAHSDL